MGEGKQPIDAEVLIHWAADELRKRRPGSGSIAEKVAALVSREEAELVGRWSAPAFFPEISPMFATHHERGGAVNLLGETHADAIEIERALAALGREPPRIEGEAAIVAHDIGLGIDPESALDAARRNLVALVLGHGALKSRPEWRCELKVRPFVTFNGQVGIFRRGLASLPILGGGVETVEGQVGCQAVRKGIYPSGAYCALVYDPAPQAIAAGRADYLIWRLALSALALRLTGRLARFEPVEPAAPLAPWIGE